MNRSSDVQKAVTARQVERDLEAVEFDHSDWARAEPVNITRLWSGEEAPLWRHAEVRIIWSEESLGVRFLCRQTEPTVVSAQPQLDRKTIGLWNRDVCEIFIAPDPNMPYRYFEFEAAPSGEWVDLAIRFQESNRETDFGFNSGMTVAASVAAETLTLAMRIPWSESIPKPKKGETWRVNLFRCIGVGNERYLAWKPSFTAEPNFHVPEVFGSLEFV